MSESLRGQGLFGWPSDRTEVDKYEIIQEKLWIEIPSRTVFLKNGSNWR